MFETNNRLVVLYGSQTFTAQEIAERVWRTTKALGFRGPVQAMDDYPIAQLIREEFAIFVCATAGQGDEPDNMKRFWKFLLKRNLPNNSLLKLKFAILALGDSSFMKFNYVGKKLHKRLIQLGATPLLNVGLCDYQHDLGHDGVMIPWLKELWEKLKNFFPYLQIDNIDSKFIPRWRVSLMKNSTNKLSNSECISEDMYFAKRQYSGFFEPKQLMLVSNIRTTDKNHFQDVRLLTFKPSDEMKLNYKPGDVFNLRPRNSIEDINELFEIFHDHNMDIEPHYHLLLEEIYDGEHFLKNNPYYRH